MELVDSFFFFSLKNHSKEIVWFLKPHFEMRFRQMPNYKHISSHSNDDIHKQEMNLMLFSQFINKKEDHKQKNSIPDHWGALKTLREFQGDEAKSQSIIDP